MKQKIFPLLVFILTLIGLVYFASRHSQEVKSPQSRAFADETQPKEPWVPHVISRWYPGSQVSRPSRPSRLEREWREKSPRIWTPSGWRRVYWHRPHRQE